MVPGSWQQQPTRLRAAAAARLASAAPCLSSRALPAAAGFRKAQPWQHPSGRSLSAASASDDDVDVVGEMGDSDAFLEELEELEEDVAPEINAGAADWGKTALGIAQKLLARGQGEGEGFTDLELYSFRAVPSSKRLDIRLDKMTDEYGSPSLDEVIGYSRAFNAELVAALGEEAAGEIEVEVSSPGAERQVRVPGELSRFAQLPMKVEYAAAAAASEAAGEAGSSRVETKILALVEAEGGEGGGVSRWRLADVRANRSGGKGRGLNKKQREAVLEIPVAALRRITLHIDI